MTFATLPAMIVTVTVMPKPSVLDPQGAATAEAMRHSGMEGVRRVRVGKTIEIEFEQAPDRAALEKVARELLSNPVIEDFFHRRMRFAVVRFPGSNCDQDCLWALATFPGASAGIVWHKERSVAGYDVVILPGGFSYGDYLRCGAIARFSPVMRAVAEFAGAGGLVLGICNGFQILCEAGLLPGALVRNRDLLFVCEHVPLRVETTATPFTRAARKGEVLRIPIAHGEGCYFADDATLETLRREDRIVLRYAAGRDPLARNPNGSRDDIAGICNEGRNVFGLMPHPERACHPELGSTDGRAIFSSLLEGWGGR